MRILTCLLLCAMALTGSAATPLRVMGFAGSSDWPMFVAQAQGYFAKRGLDVELLATRSSASQMRALLAGDIDIAMTAMDNVIAADTHDRTADVTAVMAINRGGRARLVATPAIESIPQLRGRSLAVDAVDTGYAFVLMELLHRGGLEPGDYTLVSAGGSPDRLAALEGGRAAAALLNAPVDAVAQAKGFRVLGSAADVVSHYQGSVAAARRAWLRDHAEHVVAFIRAYIDAVDWLADPSHRDAAIALFVDRVRGISTQQAAKSYGELLDASAGTLSPRAAMDVEGVHAVLELRARYGRRVEAFDRDPYRYYDPIYYQRAIAHD